MLLEQVVDGLESFYSKGCLDKINSIRQSISGKTHTVVFNDCHRYACVRVVQNLLTGSVRRLSLNSSLTSQSACIIQSVNMCLSKEKLPKVCGLLKENLLSMCDVDGKVNCNSGKNTVS